MLNLSFTDTIQFAFIISMIINAINVCFWEGHIFEAIGDKMEDYKIWKPIAGCIVCMTPWWGVAICLLFSWPVLSIPVAMGINVLIVRWEPKDEVQVVQKDVDLEKEVQDMYD